MTKRELPKPGRGYLARTFIGEGAYKDAYRAVNKNDMKDVALLKYRDPAMFEEFEEEARELMKVTTFSVNKYLAVIHEYFRGEDGGCYIVEELLQYPIAKLVPLTSTEKFLKIARDLSNGLFMLHSHGKVHRDIKLDNCGIDYTDTAKIFDLGLVTSEGSKRRGTIATRAPELFNDNPKYVFPCDVWSLGATLYAVVVGSYPIVTFQDLKRRREEGLKEVVDEDIRHRYSDRSVWGQLHENLKEMFAGEVEGLLARMLSRDPAKRPTANGCAQEWDKMYTDYRRRTLRLSDPIAQDRKMLEAEIIEDWRAFLELIKSGDMSVTRNQWDHFISSMRDLKGQAHSRRDHAISDRNTDSTSYYSNIISELEGIESKSNNVYEELVLD